MMTFSLMVRFHTSPSPAHSSLADNDDNSIGDPSYYERVIAELAAPLVNVSTESPHWDWAWADIVADMCINTAEPTAPENAR